MSESTHKMPLAEAEALARNLIEQLRPACERIEIAGSVRRKCPEVGDIELVCIPKRALDLFGGEGDSLLDRLLEDHPGLHFFKGGDRYKKFMIVSPDTGSEICFLDLFITDRERWGIIFTIRTGPAEFSKRLVTDRQHGGMMPSYLKVQDGRIWSGDKALLTPEEGDVFAICQTKWIPPEERQ